MLRIASLSSFFLSFVPLKKKKKKKRCCTISTCFQIRPDSARRFSSPMHAPKTQLADYAQTIANDDTAPTQRTKERDRYVAEARLLTVAKQS